MYNQEAIWWSEGYSSKASALNAIESAKRNGASAQAFDETASLEDPLAIFRDVEIPASDRVVSPDHNSPEYRDFEAAHEKLADKLRRSNDLREFSAEELVIARSEVAAIGEEARKSTFRSLRLWEIAKTTIFWIVEKAVDGIIKALAVGVLIALAQVLGISLPIA